MRRTSILPAVLLAAALLTPAPASAQGFDYAPADPVLPLPLYNTHPGLGGPYVYGDFVFFHQTNPLKDQIVAYRGFIDVDGSVTGGPAGTFAGSGTVALNTHQVTGPETYEPGFRAGAGWKFADQSTLSVDFIYINLARYNAAATSAAPGLKVGQTAADSFLTSFVFNFPNAYAGPSNKVSVGNAFALYGIWDGASIMTLEFVQRSEGIDVTYRVPVVETETYRLSGIVGPRYFWIWERFRWRTTSLAVDGTTPDGPRDVALYENIVSNEMYGAFIGCENEWYLGHGFACYLNMDAALLLDHVKEKADYQFGDKYEIPQNKRAILDYTAVPELEGKVGIAWYAAEGIQLRLDYNAMVFFNTIAGRNPISFNYGGLDPGWDHFTRLFDGFTAGISFVF
jgi:hypothetical protein